MFNFETQMKDNYFNMQPSEVKGNWNNATHYYKRYLYNKVFSVFDFKIPENWELNYFRFWLFKYGSIGVIYTREFGWICSQYSISKLGLYYKPREIIVTNSFIGKEKIGVMGVNAGIVRLLDDYYGIDDLITHYATKLADIDKDIDINIMNANVSVLAEADSKKKADTIKEAYAEATTGKPFVIVGKDVLSDKTTTMFKDIGNSFIGNDLLLARQTIVNEFLTEIGIPNANTDKRERLISDEVNANNVNTSANVTVMLENMKKCFKEINEISNLGLDVKLKYDFKEEEENE